MGFRSVACRVGGGDSGRGRGGGGETRGDLRKGSWGCLALYIESVPREAYHEVSFIFWACLVRGLLRAMRLRIADLIAWKTGYLYRLKGKKKKRKTRTR